MEHKQTECLLRTPTFLLLASNLCVRSQFRALLLLALHLLFLQLLLLQANAQQRVFFLFNLFTVPLVHMVGCEPPIRCVSNCSTCSAKQIGTLSCDSCLDGESCIHCALEQAHDKENPQLANSAHAKDFHLACAWAMRTSNGKAHATKWLWPAPRGVPKIDDSRHSFS